MTRTIVSPQTPSALADAVAIERSLTSRDFRKKTSAVIGPFFGGPGL